MSHSKTIMPSANVFIAIRLNVGVHSDTCQWELISNPQCYDLYLSTILTVLLLLTVEIT